MRDFPGFKLARIEPDRPDLRDRLYTPSLRPVRPKLDPPAKLRQTIRKLVRNQLNKDKKRVRDQFDGEEDFRSSCAAQALCGVIDILRMGDAAWSWDDQNPKVSAEMLHGRAREIEAAENGKNTPAKGLKSLRSAIKAVYYNGICTERDWTANEDPVERAKSARGIPLGAYYRLRAVLNDYHAALNDVGAIYAAAEIHDGWNPDLVAENQGRIVVPSRIDQTGHHAFVIVGYDEDGFLILNSWGPAWGGYRQWPGIAHWSYRDWAERIIDGWVLRLGVPTPASFEFSIGERGLGVFLSGSIGATPPRYNVIGHYIHLDDGDFVKTGPFPSDAKSIATTVKLLNDRAAGEQAERKEVQTKLLLWIAGGDEGTNEAVSGAIAAKPYWKQQCVYPLTVLWCSDFFESTQPVLNQIFQTAREKIGTAGEDLNRQIEVSTRRIGRAFWRDIKDSARRAARKGDDQTSLGSGMYIAFKELLNLNPQIKIHVVAEGAGAILFGELIKTLIANKQENSISRIATLTLLAPSFMRVQFEEGLREWCKLRKRKILLLVPHQDARLTVGLYQRSVLDLVERSFEEDVGGNVVVMGTAKGAQDAEKHLRDVMFIRRLNASDTSKSIGKLRVLTFSDLAFNEIIEYWAKYESAPRTTRINQTIVKSGGANGPEKKDTIRKAKRRKRESRGEDRSRVSPQEARRSKHL